jgi:hypothetical protein
MSLLGKVLLVLNLIAAVAVAVLGAMNYGKRQEWAHAVFREDRAIWGLPLNAEERDKDQVLLVNKFHEDDLKEQFPQQPVKTQIEEVERKQKEVEKQIDELVSDRNKQLVECARILLPFARTNGDRDRYLGVLALLDTTGKDEKAVKDGWDKYGKQLDVAYTAGRAHTAKPPKPRKEDTTWTFRELFEESLYLQRGELGGPFVDAMFRLQVTDAELARLRADNVPEAVVKKLEALKDKTFDNRDAFLKAVDGVLSKEEAELYRYKVYQAAGFIPKDKDFAKCFDLAQEDLRVGMVKEVKDLFPDALNRPAGPDSKPGSIEEHKRRIARLLFNLATRAAAAPAGPKAPLDLLSNPDFKRTVAVCGVKAAVRTVQDEARDTDELIQSVELERSKARSTFALQHERFIDKLVERLRATDDVKAQMAIREELANAHLVDLNKRKVDAEELENALRRSRTETAEKLKALKDLADLLHTEQIHFRDSVQENQKLEKEIRNKEVPNLNAGR